MPKANPEKMMNQKMVEQFSSVNSNIEQTKGPKLAMKLKGKNNSS